MAIASISAADLQRGLEGSDELAVLDVRREGDFATGHLFDASNLPLSQIELRLEGLVPWRDTPIILCDCNDRVAAEAAKVMAEMGYNVISILNGGVSAWQQAGHRLFSGINVASKAFGEFVQHRAQTPEVSAPALERLMQSGDDLIVLDSRPFSEYRAMSIPGAISCPGGELVYRFFETVPSPRTRVVVNCAGRTRSIIGAQSLIDAGVPNRVVALRDGAMGWVLAGHELEHGQTRRAGPPGPASLAQARERALAVARRAGVQTVDWDECLTARSDPARTTYLFDVRDPEEFNWSHPAGAISVPGGQLVQTFDAFAPVRNARIMLCDADGVRGAVTAAWLKQMGCLDVWHIRDGIVGVPLVTAPAITPTDSPHSITVAEAALLRVQTGAVLFDLADSREYKRRHIAGALFCERGELQGLLSSVDDRIALLSSADGQLAAIAAEELARSGSGVRCIAGGTAAWEEAGLSLESGRGNLPERPTDVFYRPYDHDRDVAPAMRQYLDWEVDLLHRIEGEPGVRFWRA